MIQALIIPTIAMFIALGFGLWALLRLRPQKGY